MASFKFLKLFGENEREYYFPFQVDDEKGLLSIINNYYKKKKVFLRDIGDEDIEFVKSGKELLVVHIIYYHDMERSYVIGTLSGKIKKDGKT